MSVKVRPFASFIIPRPLIALTVSNMYFCSLLSQFLVDEVSTSKGEDGSPMRAESQLLLAEDLTLEEIAHRTPGYEAGDLVRLVLALRMELMSRSEEEASPSAEVRSPLNLSIFSLLALVVGSATATKTIKTSSEFREKSSVD